VDEVRRPYSLTTSSFDPFSVGRGGVFPVSPTQGGETGLEPMRNHFIPTSLTETKTPRGAIISSCESRRVVSLDSYHLFSDIEVFRRDKSPTTESDKASSFLTGFRELELGENSLGVVLDSLVPTYKGILQLVPIPTFQGRSVVSTEGSSHTNGLLKRLGEGSLKDFSWTRGLGLEISLIQTRSDRKNPLLFLRHQIYNFVITSDIGAHRGMKSLVRVKS
jgi:hypothetical protein